ncbi:hypothetical protein DMH18_38305 [Streptomyces sp. WAC 06783]|nr:hypothetical protein DMH18_38305 [Streptomyces sp. WAC 06783]
MHAVMRHCAQAVVEQVQHNAFGRPGPRVITGKYRASWRADVQDEGPVVVAEVGTSAPQARRPEFGFVGADSLGRHYAQPPFPHLGPAVDQAAPEVFGEWELGLLARAVLIAELLDEDGERTLSVITTPGVPDWDTVGLCRYDALSVETTGRGFLGDDE